MARRLALLIGNSQFEDKEHFPPLRTPANDVTDIAAMLARHGDFEILGTLVDAAEPAIRRAIADLYNQAERGDLTLLYYSGHGQKGTDGSLYLAARDTDFRRLRATGVRESYIQETMADSHSRHHVVVLDCCFSGAFAQGMKRGAAEPLLLEKLKGEATAILASSGMIQYSFEEKGRNSLFTGALLAGTETGQADENGDGLLTVDELFAYADRQIRDQRRDQTPMLAQQKREIENVVLVRNPLGKAKVVSLPVTITPPSPPEAQTKGAVPATMPPQPVLPGWLWGVGGALATLALVFLLLWLSERGGDPPETPASTLPAVAQVTETLTMTPTGTRDALTIDALPAAITPGTRVSAVDGMTQLYVPAGSFLMGSTDADANARSDEQPQHDVYQDGFWIDETEVTNAQYVLFLNDVGSHLGQCDGQDCIATKSESSSSHILLQGGNYEVEDGFADHPVILVSWYGASAYCAWAGRALPTEAQWEKAARGEDGRIYPWGDASPTCDLANVYVNDYCVGSTSPVGSYAAGASPYGALDMAGNVWEWVADWYDSGYYQNSPPRNPTGPADGSSKALRGGSWVNYASNVIRAAYRYFNAPAFRDSLWGFRCAEE